MENNVVITLTHANNNQAICFVKAQIFYFYYSEAHKATHIVSIGGAYAPVKESVEHVRNALLTEGPSGGAK